MSLFTVPIDLSGAANPHLNFWHRYELEEWSDYGCVCISNDGGENWDLLDMFTGENPEWEEVSISLAYYTGRIVLISFNLYSDGSVNYDGWYIDDISVLDYP